MVLPFSWHLPLPIRIYSPLVSEERVSLLLPKASAPTSALGLRAPTLRNSNTSVIPCHSQLTSFQITWFLGLYEHTYFSIPIKWFFFSVCSCFAQVTINQSALLWKHLEKAVLSLHNHCLHFILYWLASTHWISASTTMAQFKLLY